MDILLYLGVSMLNNEPLIKYGTEIILISCILWVYLVNYLQDYLYEKNKDE